MGFYIFGRMSIQARHNFPLSRILECLFALTASPLSLVGSVGTVAFAALFWQDRVSRLALLSAPFLFGGSILTASSYGGGFNSLFPVLFIMAVLAGLGVEKLLRNQAGAAPVWLVIGLLLFQFDARAPYHINKARGKFDQDFVQLVEFLQEQKGSMYAPSCNVITLMAGQPLCDDIVLARYIEPKTAVAVERIQQRMSSGDYEWLVCSKHERDLELMSADARRAYRQEHDFGSWVLLRKRPHSDSGVE
jgi:hypothetical protein